MTLDSFNRRAVRRLSKLRRPRPGRAALDIQRLVSPLRYDVLVRAQLLTSLRDGRQTNLTRDQDELANDPYFIWFKYVESARFFPHLLKDPDLLLERFRLRVASAATTLRSYEKHGFNLRFPVTLLATPRIAITDSGVQVSKELHIGDGCHRLAALLIHHQTLRPEMYRIARSSGPVLDNTAVLLPHLQLDDAEYAEFLSHGYVDHACSSLPELRTAVLDRSPERIAEFDQIVSTHQRARRTGV